jgi:hypothetical protein
MDDQRRRVLQRVADGELSPADAAVLLDELEAEAQRAQTTSTAWRPHAESSRAARIRITRTLWSVEAIGDPLVWEAVAEGPHLARRLGDTWVIEGELGEEAPWGFWFGPPWPGRYRPAGWPSHRSPWSLPGPGSRMAGPWFQRPPTTQLRVRLNPELPLEVETQVGSVRIQDVHSPLRVTVQAGRVGIEGCPGPLNVSIQAGTVQVRSRLVQGTSRICCEAGAVQVHLKAGSSLRVRAASTLGRVSFNDAEASPSWTVGSGEGELEVCTTIGPVRITTEQ